MADIAPESRQLSRSEAITTLIHYYRAESARALAWRERLDRTTNWAVGTAAAFLGFSFSHPELPHAIFLFALAMVYILLVVEGRRFRFYDAYEFRVRLLHQHFVAEILQGRLEHGPDAPWRQALAEDLLHPRYKMTRLEAIGQRIHSNYIFLFGVLLAAWMLKIQLHPAPVGTFREFLTQAGMGRIPGWLTLTLAMLFAGHLVVLQQLGSRARGGRDLIFPGRVD
jgi:uncharacterized membrane protein